MAIIQSKVVVIGAGPYGLSADAHLLGRGVETMVFGEPMSFWEQCMPKGLLLRSPWEASQFSDPQRRFTLEAFQASRGISFSAPIPIDTFVEYGKWFQSRTIPHIDRRKVSLLEKNENGFKLTLDDQEQIQARRVIVAGGISQFASCPAELAGLPRELASHSMELTKPRKYTGKRVIVIGGGQSALESAALLHEVGADVEVIVRDRQVHWTWQRPWLHQWPVRPLLYAWPDVGPAFVSHFIARPGVYRSLSRSTQDQWYARAVRGTGIGWLKPRLQHVQISTGQSVSSATVSGNSLRLRMTDGTERTADHVVMGTGFQINLAKYGFFSPSLLSLVDTAGAFPKLDRGYQTSVAGLHILGAPAAWSFGPLMRFVAGADFAARSVAYSIAGHRSPASMHKTTSSHVSLSGIRKDV